MYALHLHVNCSNLHGGSIITDSAAERRSNREAATTMPISISPGVAGYLQAIQNLAPLVVANREAFDRERRLPNPVFDALGEAGLFRLWLPQALGGPELSPFEFMTVVEAAAALDGSVGWLVGETDGVKMLAPNMGDLDSDGVQASGFIRIPTQAVTREVALVEAT